MPPPSRETSTIRPGLRCYLFYGSDEARSRELAASTIAAFGSDVERVDLHAAQIKDDPSLLVDEAAALSLFSVQRCIRVDGVGEDCLPAIKQLLNAPRVGNPVFLLASTLKKDSGLLRALKEDSSSQVVASHPSDARDLERLAVTTAASLGLHIHEDVAKSLVDTTEGDRAVLMREIEKLATYVDATPEAPKRVSDAALDAIGVDRRGTGIEAVVDSVCSRDSRGLQASLLHLSRDGSDDVLLTRSVLKRLFAMAAARADIERGSSVSSAIERSARSIFWRDREKVAADLPRWGAGRLSSAIRHVAAAERSLKSGRGAGSTGLHQLLTMIVGSVSAG